MLCTSYFGAVAHHPAVKSGELVAVSIARFLPRGWPEKYTIDGLRPYDKWLAQLEHGDLPFDAFRTLYTQHILSMQDAFRLVRMYTRHVLVCYCKDPSLCHRRLVAEWIIAETGVDVPELAPALPPPPELDPEPLLKTEPADAPNPTPHGRIYRAPLRVTDTELGKWEKVLSLYPPDHVEKLKYETLISYHRHQLHPAIAV